MNRLLLMGLISTLITVGCVKEHEYAHHGYVPDARDVDVRPGDADGGTAEDVAGPADTKDARGQDVFPDGDAALHDALDLPDVTDSLDGKDVADDADADAGPETSDTHDTHETVCQPDCTDKSCGDDGCGSTCGACDSGYECQEGVCEPDCVALCDGLDCGAAGTLSECDCGTCEAPDECTLVACEEHTCVESPRDCDDELECTDDGCDPAQGCTATLKPNYCLIDGTCLTETDKKPDSPCLHCVPNMNATDWSFMPPGVPCNPPHVTQGSCQGPQCHVQTCEPDWGNCDQDGNNGCETYTKTSMEHCGQCLNACAPDQTCIGGTCL